MSWKLGISFFLFGLINNGEYWHDVIRFMLSAFSSNIHSDCSSPVLYVIILSAALDLVPASTPKGLIAFCNIAPSFVAKAAWPYLLKGTIRYHRRVVGCCIMSVLGMIVCDGVAVAPYYVSGA